MSIRKLHKKAGILAGFFLLILGLTGFFLNHDQWKFQYHWTLPNSVLPDAVAKADKKLFQAKTVHPENSNWVIVAGLRGAYLSENGGLDYTLTSEHQFYALRWMGSRLLAATEDGILSSQDAGQSWQDFALQGRWVNALAVDSGNILASVDKKLLITLDSRGQISNQAIVAIPETELADGVNLSRFVRDFHYGRGFLDDGWSLLLNDIATWILLFSTLSGFWIWFALRSAKKRAKEGARESAEKNQTRMPLIKKVMAMHSYGVVLLAIPFLFLLAVTGIVLDHSKFFNKPLKSVHWSMDSLPPVYKTLREDIWSVDIELDEDRWVYRMGNRYGVYESTDLQSWKKVSDGFAYRMKRLDDTLYVSGMGAPARTYHGETGWMHFKAPHMFRDIYHIDGKQVIFCGHSKKADHQTPKLNDSTFYSIMLTLHDGTFFAEWWIWVNDIASILLIILLATGLLRWLKKPNLFKKLNRVRSER